MNDLGESEATDAAIRVGDFLRRYGDLAITMEDPPFLVVGSGANLRVSDLQALVDGVYALPKTVRQRDQARDIAVHLEQELAEIRAVLDEDVSTRARFQVDTSTSYGPRFLSRIRAILDRDR